MTFFDRGRLRSSYSVFGEFILRYVTILMSEDTEFVFLSEDDGDLLIAETNKAPLGRYREGYGFGGELDEGSKSRGVIRRSYKTKGTYEREEL